MKKLRSFFLLAIVVTAFASCKKAMGPNDAYSYVMAFNGAASTSGNTLNVAIGTQSVNDIPFGAHSIYTRVDCGDNDIVVTSAGDSVNTSVSFKKDKNYSLFIIDDSSRLKTMVAEDVLPGNTDGITNFRFLQFSPDAPAMDIVIGGEVIFADRSYNDQATDSLQAAFKTMISGAYDIEVRDHVTSNVLYTFYAVPFEDGKTINIIAKGSINGINDQGFGITLLKIN